MTGNTLRPVLSGMGLRWIPRLPSLARNDSKKNHDPGSFLRFSPSRIEFITNTKLGF